MLGSSSFSARGSAIKGFSQIFKNSYFLLNKNFDLKIRVLLNFIKKNKGQEFVIFGFTSFIWSYLINELERKKINIPKNNGILIHGGGWKKNEGSSY